MANQFYTHSRGGEPPESWHRLEDHLKSVAELTRKFADDFLHLNFLFFQTQMKGGELAI